MRIAVSNIAWRREDDEEVAALLGERSVALEIAPTVVWPHPLLVSEHEAARYRRFWEQRGVAIVAMQSLLYGHPELRVFGEPSARQATLDYLREICRLAAWLGATRLVFGSPSNRRAGDMAPAQRLKIASEFFKLAGDAAAEAGVTLCLEPNPPQYGCDFVNSASEARELIDRVDSFGFALHLDSGAMTLQGEPPGAIGVGALPLHFHISEPSLAPLGSSPVDHAGFARALRDSGFDGWCSIEARRQGENATVDAVARNLSFAIDLYGAD